MTQMSVKLYVMTHKRFDVPENPMYIPLHVGHKSAKEDFGYTGDDTGDNISDLNCYYAELSGVYWVWKNVHNADCVGICHYRRFLVSEEDYVFSEAEYEEILARYDIVTTKQLELPGTYRDGFCAHHDAKVFDETGRVIKELCPEYYDTFVSLSGKNKTYFGNIMVAKKELYDAYCEWLFAILFALQARIDLNFADDYHRRVFGFISEFLLYVWVTVRGLRAYECRVAVIGEKKETGEVTEKMRKFFREKDARGAREYFSEVIQKRPDIIMEASDTSGECKLCMQAMFTANMELDTYGKCFLETVNEYDAVIAYFRRINSLASGAVQAVITDRERRTFARKTEYAQTIEEKEESGVNHGNVTQVSDIALCSAIQIFAANSGIAKRARQYAIKNHPSDIVLHF